MPDEHVAHRGETLCRIAREHGFADCRPLRAANPDLADRRTLRNGDVVTIPDRQTGQDSGETEEVHEFVRPSWPPPKISIIKENGSDYPDPEPARDADDFDPHYPDVTRPPRHLHISNYHVDRAGNGTSNVASSRFYGYHERSSRDPDHFKVQVYDNSVPSGTREVRVRLYAMKPTYRTRNHHGRRSIRPTGRHRYPSTNDRKLRVTCQRVGQTNYFRSPYLRLVTFEADKNARSRQSLLVKDYYDDGADDNEKRFTEILDHHVRATYELVSCPNSPKCRVLDEKDLYLGFEVRMAFHMLRGSNCQANEVREAVYKWTRRGLAQTATRPVIKVLRTVPVPQNMFTISDGHGRHANGQNASNQTSEITVTIDETDYTVALSANDSPMHTGSMLERQLEHAGFSVDRHSVKVSGLTPVANRVSSPCDVVVKRNNNPVQISSAASTDTRQGVVLTDDINVNNFVIGWPFQPRQTRSVSHNYKTRYMDFFIIGTRFSVSATLLGRSPYGNFDGYTSADVGPAVFITQRGVANWPHVVIHEMMHPLMHMHHAFPPNDTHELMNPFATAESKDAARRIADGRIVAKYRVLHGNTSTDITLNGRWQGLGSGLRFKTPVLRFHQVAASYRFMRGPRDRNPRQG